MTGKCPDHPTTKLARVPGSEGVYVCPLDGKKYDYTNGFVKNNGEKIEGASIHEQTPNMMGANY